MRKFQGSPFAGASLGVVSIGALCVLASLSSSPAASHEEAPQPEAPQPEAPHGEMTHKETAHEHGAGEISSTRNATGEKKTAREIWLDQLWKASDAAYHKGDYPLAIEKFKAIVALDPSQTEAFSTGAWLMWSLGNADEATAFVRRGVALNPNDGDAWETAADHFDMRKALAQEALLDYRKALELAPPDKDMRLLRHRVAIAAQIAGDLGLATQTWTQIVKDYPTDTIAANKLQLLKDGKPIPAPRVESATSSTRSEAPVAPTTA